MRHSYQRQKAPRRVSQSHFRIFLLAGKKALYSELFNAYSAEPFGIFGSEEVRSLRTDKYSLCDRLNQMQLLFWRHPEKQYTTHEIATLFEINEDTALKDLQELSESGRLPIVRRGWYWQLRAALQCELRSITADEGLFILLVQKAQRQEG